MADLTGVNPIFAQRLTALMAAVRAQGGNLTISSGYRTNAQQAALYAAYKNGTGNLAAPPGQSNHNRGLAVDLGGSLDLAHQLAPQFGLSFPIQGEAWHVEPTGLSQSSQAPAPQTYDQQMDAFMRGIRTEESSGNYSEHPNRVGASGAYQFTQGTWQGAAGPYARIYPQAWMAPPEIQDEVARQLMGSYFRQFGGDWSKVAQAWLAGPGNVGKNLSDGNITESAYARKVLGYAGLAGGPNDLNASGSVAAGAGIGATDTGTHDVDTQAQTIISLLAQPASNVVAAQADLPSQTAPDVAPAATDQTQPTTTPDPYLTRAGRAV